MPFSGKKRETLAFLDVCGRVSSLLLDIARIEGESSECGMVKIHRPSDEVISNQLGVSGTSVTKAFSTLITRGFIVARNNEIFIHQNQFGIF